LKPSCKKQDNALIGIRHILFFIKFERIKVQIQPEKHATANVLSILYLMQLQAICAKLKPTSLNTADEFCYICNTK